MWDFAMAGLGLGLFLACFGYIRVCEALRDPQPDTSPTTVTGERQS